MLKNSSLIFKAYQRPYGSLYARATLKCSKKDNFWLFYSPEVHKILSKSGLRIHTQLLTC